MLLWFFQILLPFVSVSSSALCIAFLTLLQDRAPETVLHIGQSVHYKNTALHALLLKCTVIKALLLAAKRKHIVNYCGAFTWSTKLMLHCKFVKVCQPIMWAIKTANSASSAITSPVLVSLLSIFQVIFKTEH